MKKQQGAALVIVMALLAGAIMLGMSGMQSALIDERLAGNYRASTQAQMTSDNILAALASDQNKIARENALTRLLENGDEPPDMDELIKEDTLRMFINSLLPTNYDDLEEEGQKEEVKKLLANLELNFEINEQDQTITITASDRGLRNSAIGSSTLIYSYRLATGDSWENRRRGLHACGKIEVTGSALLDSYDSEAGMYGGGNSKLSNMELRTWLDTSVISTSSSSPIYGSITLPGDFRANNSANVFGDIIAGKNIYLNNGGFEVYGDLAAHNDIIFQKTAKVYGNAYAGNNIEITPGGSLIEGDEVNAVGNVVLSGGADINADLRADGGVFFNNYASQVLGDVYSPIVTINSSNSMSGHILGNFYPVSSGVKVPATPLFYESVEDCDVYNVTSIYEQYDSSEVSQGDFYIDGYPENKIVILSGSDEIFYSGANGERIMKVNGFSLGGNRELHFGVEGENNDFIILVDGDLDVNGYNSKLYIANGSSVTFVVRGTVDIVGQVSNSSAHGIVARENQAKSVMNIISLYDDRNRADAGVRVRNSKFYADILAPFSRVEFANEAAYGAVLGREVSVLGYGGYHFDQAINFEGNKNCQSDLEEDCSGQNGGVNSFTLIGWQ